VDSPDQNHTSKFLEAVHQVPVALALGILPDQEDNLDHQSDLEKTQNLQRHQVLRNPQRNSKNRPQNPHSQRKKKNHKRNQKTQNLRDT
jgi:hypothetical protein